MVGGEEGGEKTGKPQKTREYETTSPRRKRQKDSDTEERDVKQWKNKRTLIHNWDEEKAASLESKRSNLFHGM